MCPYVLVNVFFWITILDYHLPRRITARSIRNLPQTMVLTLYKLDPSPPVRSVYMTIEALKLPNVEYLDINLLDGAHLQDEYLKVNPQHTVPCLKDDDFVVWDSHAIAVYLVTKYGRDDRLYSSDPKKRALIDQRLHFDSGILFPAIRGVTDPLVFWGETSIRADALVKIKMAYGFTEKFLSSGNSWLVGDEVTLADICCYSSVSSLNVILPIDEQLYPKVSAWLERCYKQDFFRKGNVPGLSIFNDIIIGCLKK